VDGDPRHVDLAVIGELHICIKAVELDLGDHVTHRRLVERTGLGDRLGEDLDIHGRRGGMVITSVARSAASDELSCYCTRADPQSHVFALALSLFVRIKAAVSNQPFKNPRTASGLVAMMLSVADITY